MPAKKKSVAVALLAKETAALAKKAGIKKKFVNPFHPKLTNNAAPFHSALHVVDVAVVKIETQQILLGRKGHEVKFRFFGGFVDPTKDKSVLDAAKREVREETGNTEVDDLIVLGQPMIQDSRYANDKDKVYTTFFAGKYIFGAPKGTDDIAEVRWFDIAKLTKDDIMPCHHELLEIFLAFYNHPRRLQ